MRTLIVALLFIVLLPSQEETTNQEAKKELPLPKAAQPDVDWYEKETKTINLRWVVSMNAANAALRKKLEVRMRDATKAGNLDEAMAVKAKIESIGPEIMVGLDGTPLLEKKDGRLVEIKPKKEPEAICFLDSEWRASTGRRYKFTKDGTVVGNNIDRGSYKIENNTCTMTWSNGVSDTFTLPIKEGTKVTNSSNAVWTFATQINPDKRGT